MKVYKYRDLSNPCGNEIQHLETILRRQTFWCARPDTLNDPEEFDWNCEYDATQDTVELLTEVLVRERGRTRDEARQRAATAVETGRLESLAKPIIAGMIQKCRNEIGVVCFGTSPENPVLWQRYGGNGSGVCVELTVPSTMLGNQLHRVQYSTVKVIHLDQIMRASLDTKHAQEVYSLALLSKPSCWAPEGEIRFISKQQEVLVGFVGSQITCLSLGNALTTDVRRKIDDIVASLPYALRVQPNDAQPIIPSDLAHKAAQDR